MELQQYNLFFLYQETFALTKRLFIQLKRRPSTLLAGILQPIIWLFLFGALFSKVPEGFLQISEQVIPSVRAKQKLPLD
jgi:ABC-2 type transport system permease protein